MSERMMSANELLTDEEENLRPSRIDEYVGQQVLKENLKIFFITSNLAQKL